MLFRCPGCGHGALAVLRHVGNLGDPTTGRTYLESFHPFAGDAIPCRQKPLRTFKRSFAKPNCALPQKIYTATGPQSKTCLSRRTESICRRPLLLRRPPHLQRPKSVSTSRGFLQKEFGLPCFDDLRRQFTPPSQPVTGGAIIARINLYTEKFPAGLEGRFSQVPLYLK